MRTISKVWSACRPSLQLRTFMEALSFSKLDKISNFTFLKFVWQQSGASKHKYHLKLGADRHFKHWGGKEKKGWMSHSAATWPVTELLPLSLVMIVDPQFCQLIVRGVRGLPPTGGSLIMFQIPSQQGMTIDWTASTCTVVEVDAVQSFVHWHYSYGSRSCRPPPVQLLQKTEDWL